MSGDRVPSSRFSEPVEAAKAVLGDWWCWVADAVFVCGVSPGFAGLHNFEDASYGRSYRNTAHTCYPFHLNGPASRRFTAVVLPIPETVETVVHELGHVLHWRLDFEPMAKPVSRYAQTDHFEAFAEAFTAHLIPGYAKPVDDPAIRYLWETL